MIAKTISSTTTISDIPTNLGGILLNGGSDAAVAIVYDSASSSVSGKTVLYKVQASANSTVTIPIPVTAFEGVHIAITGTGVVCTAYIR